LLFRSNGWLYEKQFIRMKTPACESLRSTDVSA